MSKSAPAFIFAWRYFKAKKSTNAINIIAWVSVTAIAVGAAALIIILSAFNGFEDLVKSLYSSFYTDLKVSPASGKIMTVSEAQLNKLEQIPGVARFTLVAEEKAIVQNGEKQQFVILKGVDEQYEEVTGVADKMYNGTFNSGTAEDPRLVLGAGIENGLGVYSDRNLLPLTVYMVKRTKSNVYNPLDPPTPGYVNTSGSFLIQQDFDNKYVLTHIGFMRKLWGLNDDECSGIEILLNEKARLEDVRKQIKTVFGEGYKVQTKFEQNQALFSIMNVEKWVIYGILTLIMIIAAFNIVGALMMLVLEKQKDIFVLKALGADQNFIRRIFLLEGILLALIGTAIGIIVAVLLCWIQIQFKVIPLQGGSFVIDYYPVKMLPADFLLVVLTILAIALLAAWVPAKKAATLPIMLKS
ncbi:MAG TPA: FtsX-like permease family protein [Parasegetibacter sp.]